MSHYMRSSIHLPFWLGSKGAGIDLAIVQYSGDQGEVLALIVHSWLTTSRHFSIVSSKTKGNLVLEKENVNFYLLVSTL